MTLVIMFTKMFCTFSNRPKTYLLKIKIYNLFKYLYEMAFLILREVKLNFWIKSTIITSVSYKKKKLK